MPGKAKKITFTIDEDDIRQLDAIAAVDVRKRAVVARMLLQRGLKAFWSDGKLFADDSDYNGERRLELLIGG